MVFVYSMYSKICLCKCMWAWGQSQKGKEWGERRNAVLRWLCRACGYAHRCSADRLHFQSSKGFPLGSLWGRLARCMLEESRMNSRRILKIPLISTDIRWSEGYLGVVPQAAPELLKMTSVAQGWSISYHSTSLCKKSEEHSLERKITNRTQEPDPGHSSHLSHSSLCKSKGKPQQSNIRRALFLLKKEIQLKLLAMHSYTASGRSNAN